MNRGCETMSVHPTCGKSLRLSGFFLFLPRVIHTLREAKSDAAAGSSKGDNETTRNSHLKKNTKKIQKKQSKKWGYNWTIGGRIHLKQLNL